MLTLVIFIPFILGILTKTNFLLLSLPIGLFLIFLVNLLTKSKFQYRNWIESSIIEFTNEKLIYIEKNQILEYKWKEIDDLTIKIVGYEGESRGYNNKSLLTGTENSINFVNNGKNYTFDFFFKEKKDKKKLLNKIQNNISIKIKKGTIKILTRGRTGYQIFSLNTYSKLKYTIYK